MSSLLALLPHAALVAGTYLALGPRWAGGVLMLYGLVAIYGSARARMKAGRP